MQSAGMDIKGRIGDEKAWYKKQVEYWDQQEASINGVLGGYEKVHYTDIDTSKGFIDQFADRFEHNRVLDCGAGIGRITKELLLPRFHKVDLIEPSKIQIDKAKVYVESPNVEK